MADIHEALDYGVVKMNIDTDTQYAFTRPIAHHMLKNYDGVLKVDGTAVATQKMEHTIPFLLPIDERTFHEKFKAFRVDGPGEDTVTILHHFELPPLAGKDLGLEMYRKPPWAIYRQNGSFIYIIYLSYCFLT